MIVLGRYSMNRIVSKHRKKYFCLRIVSRSCLNVNKFVNSNEHEYFFKHLFIFKIIIPNNFLQMIFYRNGCTTLLKGFDRKEHEESCYFANMLCPMIYCKCIPPRPELVRHLQLAHEMITVDTSRLKLNLFSYRENVHDKEEKRYRYNLHLISFGFLFSIDVYVFRLEFEIRMRMKKIKREKEPNGFLCSNVVLVELSCEKYVLRKSVIVTETKEKECLFQIDNAVINKAVNDGVGLTFTVSEMK